MIKTFGNKAARLLYEGKQVKQFQGIRTQVEKRLQILDCATTLEDLKRLPSNRFEALAGQRKGQYSIRVNKQWRICFEWKEGDAFNVEIVDYH